MFDWQFLVTLNERLRPLGDPVEIVEIAVRSIGEHLQASRVNYAQIEADEFVIKQSYVHGVPPLAGRGPVMRFGTATVDACRRGETVVVDDVRSEEHTSELQSPCNFVCRLLLEKKHKAVGPSISSVATSPTSRISSPSPVPNWRSASCPTARCLGSFFFTSPPLPRSTPFPYTTLFR